MPDALSQTAEDALAMFRHHQALAHQHLRKADAFINQFLGAAPPQVTGRAAKRLPQCVSIWTEWLAENGPNTRQHITDATGVKFTERGTPHTVLWDKDIADNQFPPSTIVRFAGRKPPGGGRGSPPTIYALWSQRFQVNPLFGVGPTDAEPQAMTGVIRPPESSHPIDPEFGQEEPINWDALDLQAEGIVQTVTETPEEWAARIVAMREGQTEEAVDD